MDNGSSGEYTCTWPPKLGWIMGVSGEYTCTVHDLLK